jgi:hypothetical protein
MCSHQSCNVLPPCALWVLPVPAPIALGRFGRAHLGALVILGACGGRIDHLGDGDESVSFPSDAGRQARSARDPRNTSASGSATPDGVLAGPATAEPTAVLQETRRIRGTILLTCRPRPATRKSSAAGRRPADWTRAGLLLRACDGDFQLPGLALLVTLSRLHRMRWRPTCSARVPTSLG